MATKDELDPTLLRQILDELKQLNETISLFTTDGLPLQRQVPTTETLAALLASGAMLSKADPRMSPADADARIRNAQALGTRMVQQTDAYLDHTQRTRLENLTKQ